jgi:hypothetical protein
VLLAYADNHRRCHKEATFAFDHVKEVAKLAPAA